MRRTHLALGTLLVTLACAAHDTRRTHGVAVKLGAQIPVYAARTLADAEVTIGAPNDSLTLLNVWATWCTSCREEMEDLEALHRAYAPRGVRRRSAELVSDRA